MGPFFETQCRNIALSYGVHIFPDNYLVLSQNTRLTDRQTDRRTDRQNVDSNTERMLCSRTVKIDKTFPGNDYNVSMQQDAAVWWRRRASLSKGWSVVC